MLVLSILRVRPTYLWPVILPKRGTSDGRTFTLIQKRPSRIPASRNASDFLSESARSFATADHVFGSLRPAEAEASNDYPEERRYGFCRDIAMMRSR